MQVNILIEFIHDLIIYMCHFLYFSFDIDLSWLTSLGPIVLLLLGSFVGYFLRGHLQKRASKTEVINRLIDSIDTTMTEMRKQAFHLLKDDENSSIEIAHHIFVAQNARLQKICTDITHHDNKNYPSIPIEKLRTVKKTCDEVIESHHSAHVYGALIHSQSDLLDSFRYITTN